MVDYMRAREVSEEAEQKENIKIDINVISNSTGMMSNTVLPRYLNGYLLKHLDKALRETITPQGNIINITTYRLL